SVFFPAAGGRTNHGDGRGSLQAVKLQILDQYVVIGNGIVEVKLTNPGGQLTGVWYNGVDNLLEVVNGEHDRGYWDVVWKGEGIARKKGALDRLECEKLSIITEDEEQV
ncbi:hypothetical protein LINPERHAP2_LOCUS12185, partial [Linum perenne]